MQRLSGVGASPGIVVGRAVLFMQNPLVVRFPISEMRTADELARLDAAQQRSRQQLQEIRTRVASGPASELAYLFDAQLLMLDDPMLVPRAREIVKRQRVNAEWAILRAFEDLSQVFDDVEDAYLRERKGDVADIVGRMRMNLGRGRVTASDLFRDVMDASILIADELTPSMAAQIDWHKIRGFASDTGSRTSHTAILLRSLGVPAVVGLGRASSLVPPGAMVVIDGAAGELIVNPPDDMLHDVARRAEQLADDERTVIALGGAPALTTDGVSVCLRANIELAEDVELARRYGADGIGLYRSEFLLATAPLASLTEEVQYAAYRQMVEAMSPAGVTIRTFDVDEERFATGYALRHGTARVFDPLPRPHGPMGLRAVRLLLSHRDVFRCQLRALLRASVHGRLQIVLPFVSGLDELLEARRVLDEARQELAARGDRPPEVPVGVMIEIPSAAGIADLLGREADFFSIGTNDLIQYTLAVDRSDPRVSDLYEPLHPAMLRMIRGIVRAAAQSRVPVSLCGEMAADPVMLPVLVGLGLSDFSMSPSAIPAAKDVLRRVDGAAARRLSRRLLRFSTVGEIHRYLSKPARGIGRT